MPAAPTDAPPPQINTMPQQNAPVPPHHDHSAQSQDPHTQGQNMPMQNPAMPPQNTAAQPQQSPNITSQAQSMPQQNTSTVPVPSDIQDGARPMTPEEMHEAIKSRRETIKKELAELGPEGQQYWEVYQAYEKDIMDQVQDEKAKLDRTKSLAIESRKQKQIIGGLISMAITAVSVTSAFLIGKDAPKKWLKRGAIAGSGIVGGSIAGGLVNNALNKDSEAREREIVGDYIDLNSKAMQAILRVQEQFLGIPEQIELENKMRAAKEKALHKELEAAARPSEKPSDKHDHRDGHDVKTVMPDKQAKEPSSMSEAEFLKLMGQQQPAEKSPDGTRPWTAGKLQEMMEKPSAHNTKDTVPVTPSSQEPPTRMNNARADNMHGVPLPGPGQDGQAHDVNYRRELAGTTSPSV